MAEKNDNFKVNKSVMNFIHARDYFPKGEVEGFRPLIEDVHWEPRKYGKEIPDFNLIFNNIDVLWGKMLGDFIDIDRPVSGTFRRPYPVIHFEDFDSLNEWRFIVAMEDNEFKTYVHKSGAKTALDGYEFDYFNPDDWEVETIIKLKANDSLFFRPWNFHSFNEGVIHYYKLFVQ